jgi:GNAT superfamily N-acetyltransferase
MTPAEFEECLAREIVRVAADFARRGVWTEETALEASRSDFADLLPRGFETPNYRFCKVVDERTGGRVGETWYVVVRKGGKVHFWVDWIWIDPPFRRKGYATRLLQKLDDEAVREGAERIGLSVVTDNPEALALYTKVGYTPTRMHMSKTLGPAP